MNQGFRFFPDQASSIAPELDHLYYLLTAVALGFTALIFIAIVVLGIT